MLVEPNEQLRGRLVKLLGCHGLAVLAVGDRAAAVAGVWNWRPTVAVVDPYGWQDQGDARGGALDVVHAVTDLRAADPRLPIVLHTETYALEMLLDPPRLGVVRHVVKGCPPEQLLTAVWDAHAVSRWRMWSAPAEVAQ